MHDANETLQQRLDEQTAALEELRQQNRLLEKQSLRAAAEIELLRSDKDNELRLQQPSPRAPSRALLSPRRLSHQPSVDSGDDDHADASDDSEDDDDMRTFSPRPLARSRSPRELAGRPTGLTAPASVGVSANGSADATSSGASLAGGTPVGPVGQDLAHPPRSHTRSLLRLRARSLAEDVDSLQAVVAGRDATVRQLTETIHTLQQQLGDAHNTLASWRQLLQHQHQNQLSPQGTGPSMGTPGVSAWGVPVSCLIDAPISLAQTWRRPRA